MNKREEKIKDTADVKCKNIHNFICINMNLNNIYEIP